MVLLLVKRTNAEQLLPKLKPFRDAQGISTTLEREGEPPLRSSMEKKNY
jgi:hypothetical protein